MSTRTSKFKLFVAKCGSLTEAQLTQYFRTFGAIFGQVEIAFEPSSGRSKGFAFVCFMSSEVAATVVKQKTHIHGKAKMDVQFFEFRSGTFYASDMKNEKILQDQEKCNRASFGFKCKDTVPNGVLPYGQQMSFNVTISNHSTTARTLKSVVMYPFRREIKIAANLSGSSPTKGKFNSCADKYRNRSTQGKLINPGKAHTIEVSYNPGNHARAGICDIVVSFEFEGSVTFSHQCNLTIANADDMKLLGEEFKHEDETKGVWDGKERKLIRAEPLPRSTLSHRHVAVDTDYVESLGCYPVPQNLQSDIDGHDRFFGFDPWLKRDTYRDRLHSLLWIEEAAEIKAMRRFDLASVQFEAHREPVLLGGRPVDLGTLHALTAEGLAERRPSVLPNDRLIAWEASGETDVEFEGWVAHTTATQIRVRFDGSFPSDRTFHVRFEFDRMPFRCMHRAVDRCPIDLLWPDADACKGVRPAGGASGGRAQQASKAVQPEPEDLGVELDDHQRAAIAEICGRRAQLLAGAKQAPFLLRGSFGCGKTHTLVQCIRAVLRADASARVLVCSECNSVADMICCHLAPSLLPAQMLRFNAFFRPVNTLQGDVNILKHYCCYQDDSQQVFGVPSLDTLLTYSVVASTATASATLFGMGVGQTHFSHIFLDECAQMMEPAALIPLCLAGRHTAVVLCGDELQVGPAVRSPSAKHHGLHQSLMERLAGGLTARRSTHQELYRLEAGKAGGSLTRRLLSNYRSHPRLLALPSALFYGGALQAVGRSPTITSLCDWKGLPTPGFPFMFVGVEGQDERDTNHPSYYNRFEAMDIKERVKRLVSETGLAPNDVVVIAPYKSQIAAIRKLLRGCGLGDVSVGLPAVIQGREASAVFVSTVRAMGSKYLDVDSVCNLGLLHDPRLINTVLTRATALCVIVGDARLLARHNIWGRVLQYAVKNGGFMGQLCDDAGVDCHFDCDSDVDTGDGDASVEEGVYKDCSESAGSLDDHDVPLTDNRSNGVPEQSQFCPSTFNVGQQDLNKKQATAEQLKQDNMDATPAQNFGASNEWPALPKPITPSNQALWSGPNQPMASPVNFQQQKVWPSTASRADPGWVPLFSLPQCDSEGGGGTGGGGDHCTVPLVYMRSGLLGAPAFSVRRLEGRPGYYVGILAVEFCLFHTAATVHLDNGSASEIFAYETQGSVRVDIRASVALCNALHFRPPTEYAGRDPGPRPGELIAQALVVPPGVYGHIPNSTASTVAALLGWSAFQVGPVVACVSPPGTLMLLLPDPYGAS